MNPTNENLTIKNTYHDALFYASAFQNNKQEFYLRAEEYKLIQKLIHYSTIQTNITWSSENIGKHLYTTPTAIDKNIQRLNAKGYINITTTQIAEKVKSRTIYINWNKLEEINKLIKLYQNENVVTEITTPIVEQVENEIYIPIEIINEDVSEISNEITDEKELAMKLKFDNKFRAAPQGNTMMPADFHSLTNDYFLGDTSLWRITSKLKNNDFRTFWNTIQELKLKTA